MTTVTQPPRTEPPPDPGKSDETAWHALTAPDVLARLQTDTATGLTGAEAGRRLEQHGRNELTERGTRGPWAIIKDQVASIMIVILVVAAIISAVVGDLEDSVVILIIVALNAALGFFQEYRAEQAMAALKRMSVPTVRVRRDGRVQEQSARNLVPGDIVLLEAGNVVPADCRVLESMNLRLDEAALTGESEPVQKDPNAAVEEAAAIGDRPTMIFMGTVVSYGRGLAVVAETAMSTELGRIASMLQTVEHEQTPLQKRLDHLGRILVVAALAIVGVILVIGLVRGEELTVLLLTAISMAVAAVPEGLPAVVTIALALGAQRMLKRRALIRKLSAVETLGSVTVICSDKTGTLTQNRMAVAILDVAGQRLNVTEHVPAVNGALRAEAEGGQPDEQFPDLTALALLVAGGALCSDATLEHDPEQPDGVRATGDPTEAALVVVAARAGLRKPELDILLPRVSEQPFDSERKRMTTVHAAPTPEAERAAERVAEAAPALRPLVPERLGIAEGCAIAFTKGAVDSLLRVTGSVWADDRVQSLTPEWREKIENANNQLAQDGMRVLGLAYRVLSPDQVNAEDDYEHDLVFVGMVGIIDPPRPEAREAVQTCSTAGIRPVMITGDHPLTAHYIARSLSITEDGGHVMTGQELDRMDVEELTTAAQDVGVFARVSPEHKLKIVQALRGEGHIVAMTGDGVNDAPALKQADIGVAMGITGTDVSKEAADMVLLDDNFATIVAAVEEGRVIYDNIRKFIKYMMTTNSAELAVMLFGPLLGMPLPLLPLQILWMNLVTDGPTAVALGFEPAEKGTMRRPPYRPDESILGQGIGRHIVWVGILMAFVSLGTGFWYWLGGHESWQTMVFTVLVLAQLAHVMAIRSGQDSLFRIGLRSNLPLLGAVGVSILLQLGLLYLPFAQEIFTTVPLPVTDLAIAVLAASVIFWAVEMEKLVLRRNRARRAQAQA